MSDAPASPSSKPVVYLVYGDDPLAIGEFVDSLLARVSPDPGLADMNISRLAGKEATLDALHKAAYSLPFLTERRLVVAADFLAEHFSKAPAQEKLITLLDGLPETTAFVLVVHDTFLGGKRGWDFLGNRAKFLSRWAEKAGSRVHQEVCRLPSLAEMPARIQKQARKEGGTFTPAAASALTALVGADTAQARQEILKLLAYVDYKRPVEAEDVQELVAPRGQADVFAMVDALAMGNTRQAVSQLVVLLEEQDAMSLFGMIVRQFRLLILAREAWEEGHRTKESAAKYMALKESVNEYVAEKSLTQSRRYSLTDLESIYHQLLEIDMMMKTGQSDPEVALHTFVASLAAGTLNSR